VNGAAHYYLGLLHWNLQPAYLSWHSGIFWDDLLCYTSCFLTNSPPSLSPSTTCGILVKAGQRADVRL